MIMAIQELDKSIKLNGFSNEIRDLFIGGLKENPLERWNLDKMSHYSKSR